MSEEVEEVLVTWIAQKILAIPSTTWWFTSYVGVLDFDMIFNSKLISNLIVILLDSAVATPKQIRELMKVDGLTNDEVKSHLQVCHHTFWYSCSTEKK